MATARYQAAVLEARNDTVVDRDHSLHAWPQNTGAFERPTVAMVLID